MKDPNTHKRIMEAMVLVGAIITLFSSFALKEAEMGIVISVMGAVIVCAGIVYGIIKVRCPYCKKLLNIRSPYREEHCSHCGKKL
ncbi:MAG: hypothetical protein Q4F63_04105 [Clostridia bacterium]|nr:hypothetical protein [Clostridia bacterium]